MWHSPFRFPKCGIVSLGFPKCSIFLLIWVMLSSYFSVKNDKISKIPLWDCFMIQYNLGARLTAVYCYIPTRGVPGAGTMQDGRVSVLV